MVDPGRAGRLWLAIAVATFWAVSVGGERESAGQEPALQPAASGPAARPDPEPSGCAGGSRRRRVLGVFLVGMLIIRTGLFAGTTPSVGRMYPETPPEPSPARVVDTQTARPAG